MVAVPTCYHLSMLTLEKQTYNSVGWLTLLLNVEGYNHSSQELTTLAP